MEERQRIPGRARAVPGCALALTAPLVAACGGDDARIVEGRELPDGCGDDTFEVPADSVTVVSETRLRMIWRGSGSFERSGCAMRVELDTEPPKVIAIVENAEYGTSDENPNCLEATVPEDVTEAIGHRQRSHTVREAAIEE